MPSFVNCAAVALSADASQKRTHRTPTSIRSGAGWGHSRFLISAATTSNGMSTTSSTIFFALVLKSSASHTTTSSAGIRPTGLNSCHSRPMSMTCVGFSESGSYPTPHLTALIFVATTCRSSAACAFPATAMGRSRTHTRCRPPDCETLHHLGRNLLGAFSFAASIMSGVNTPS